MPTRSEQAGRQRLALNARRLRGQLGWTQELAAERVGCSVQALQRLERAVAGVTVDFASRLAAAYRTDVGELFVPAGPWQRLRAGRPAAPPAAGRSPRRKRSPRRRETTR